MFISIAEAQGQLLDLVRRAEAGEEVVLTLEGKAVGRIGAVDRAWKDMTPEERRKVIQDIKAKAPRKREGDPDAAHSQDFLYDEDGLPA